MNEFKQRFSLNPDIVYLNHGSFGACPKPVMENYQFWQNALEFEPVQFINKHREEALVVSKTALAQYIGCDAQDFFFVQNPTTAMNQVIKSLQLGPGDEILSTDHEYGAMDKTLDFYAKKRGFSVRRQKISLPLSDKEQFIEEFWQGYSDKTKAIFISHCTSTTALFFPVHEICRQAKSLGLVALVDGAHVPGHRPLNITALDADVYTGTIHKWLMGPKGCSFLYVKREFQQSIEPLVISWGYETEEPTKVKFLEENEMQGTRDISAFLTVPAILKFFTEYEVPHHQAICRRVILEQYPIFCDLARVQPVCRVSEEFLGQMCSIPIFPDDPARLKETLIDEFKIEIPVMQRGNEYYLRISFQVYNTMEELDYLKHTMEKLGLVKRHAGALNG